jgi:hypothetical protein
VVRGVDWFERDEAAGAFDVALHDVSAEWRAGGSGQLEVDDCVTGERGKGSSSDRFFREVGREMRRGKSDGGEADSVNRNAVPFAEARDERLGRANGETKRTAAMLATRDVAGLFDESGKHRISLPRIRCRAGRRDSAARDCGGSR